MDFTKNKNSSISVKDIIEELIPNYPSINDGDFINKLSAKEELYELRALSSEEPPKKQGELLKSQKMMQRIFSPHTPYTNALLYHAMGTGKSVVACGIVENFKKEMNPDGSVKKPALVIVKNPALIQSFTKEITNVCTAGVYDPKFTRKEILKGDVSMTEQKATRRLNENIRKSYEIITKTTLFNKNLSDYDIKKKYSNRIIFIDEAHVFRIQSKKGKKVDLTKSQAPQNGEEKKEEINEEEEGGISEIAEEDDSESVDKRTYDKMHHFLHTVEGCRIFLMTGTPIWDKTNEIASLMNLILPLDEIDKNGKIIKKNQLPTDEKFMNEYFDEDGNVLDDKVDDLRGILKGRVSYLRSIVTDAKKDEIGTVKPWMEHIKIYPDVMSDFQAKWNKVNFVEGSTDAFYIRERDHANMVYPKIATESDVEKAAKKGLKIKEGDTIGDVFSDGSFKKLVGINDKTKSSNKIGRFPEDMKKTLVGNLSNPSTDTLRHFSAKFANVIDDILNNPTQRVYIYIDGVTGSGGAISFSMILQLFGFEMNNFTKIEDINSSFKKESYLKDDSKKGGNRFTLITGSGYGVTDNTLLSEFISKDSDPKNKYGIYNRIIIGSQKISLGFSFKNIRQIHIMMSYFHLSAIQQAEDRGFRFGSHAALPKEERKIMVKHHASVYPGDYKITVGGQDLYVSKDSTADIHVYRIAERKDYRNANIYRLLKETAIDCKLNYKRSVLKQDVDYSRECDYKKCNYTCYGSDSKSNKIRNIDYSTYRLYYNTNDVYEIIDRLKKLFKNYYRLSLNQIFDLIVNDNDPKINKSVILEALSLIITNNIPLKDRLNFDCYLKESGNIYFLDTTGGLSANFPNYESVIYVEKPFVDILEVSLDMYVQNIVYDVDVKGALEYCKTGDLSALNMVSKNSLVSLIESSYIMLENEEVLNPKQISILDKLINKYKENIHTLPLSQPNKVSKYLAGNKVILHTLLNVKGKNEIDSQTRILNITFSKKKNITNIPPWNPTHWKDIDEPTISFLSKLLKKHYKPTDTSEKVNSENLEKYKIYGMYKNNKLKLFDTSKVGHRKQSGMVCGSHDIHVLVDIIYNKLKILPSPTVKMDNERAKDLITGSVLYNIHNYFSDVIEEDGIEGEDNTSNDKLRSIVTLINMNKSGLCSHIETTLKNLNLIVKEED